MTRAPTQNIISLSDGRAEIDILPEQGAAISRYEFVSHGSRHRLFEPTPFGQTKQPLEVGAILLVPWSNRISDGGFTYDGRFIALDPNVEGEPLPIHGNAFQLAWTLVALDAATARLQLHSIGPGEFRYFATLAYTLLEGALCLDLSVTNRGELALPFGLGVHPWFPRTPDMTLRFDARDVWLEDERFLPAGRVELTNADEWSFSTARALPDAWINNAFGGWHGEAEVIWPKSKIAMRIRASHDLGYCIVFSPWGSAPFFCFEPVSHPVDAHNETNRAFSNLRRLEPGETMKAWCRFEPSVVSDPIQ